MDFVKLAATPARFQAALDTLGRDRFSERPAVDEWSAAEILTHVRAADAVISPRILQVLVRPGIALPDIDERMVGERLANAQDTDQQRVIAFGARRAELMQLLATVDRDDWDLRGEYETRGPLSIADIFDSLASHEEEHLQQLASVVAGFGD